jgi:hypothetical protein
MADSTIIRPPTFSKATAPASFTLPTVEWLTETWHVTHSSLPMWKSKRNVRIKYTPLPPSSKNTPPESTDRIDDLVSYQSLTSTKLHTIAGIDSASSEASRGEWDWRGKGLLKIASSHWEVLGWGEEAGTGNKWVVTCFAKTLFTPAGVDFYSAGRGGLQVDTVDAVKKGLAEMDDVDIRKMASDLFELTIDGDRGEE